MSDNGQVPDASGEDLNDEVTAPEENPVVEPDVPADTPDPGPLERVEELSDEEKAEGFYISKETRGGRTVLVKRQWPR
jgi:hypothetical protein